MGVLDVLSGLSTAAGKAVQGYGIDQDSKVTQLLAQQKADRESERDRVLNALTQRDINTPRLGDANYAPSVAGVEGAKAAAVIPAKVAEANAMIAPKVAEQSALAPGEVRKAADTVAATTPITSGAAIKQHEAERSFDNANTPQTYSPVTTTGAGGEQKVSAFDTKSGKISDTGATAKAGGTGGMGGSLSPQAIAGMAAQAQEADRIMAAFEKKYAADPSIVGAGSGIAGGAATASGGGLLSTVEKVLGNKALGAANPEYQNYLAAQQRFGNIMGNLMSKRYTEHQGTLDTDLSGLRSGDVLPTLQLKQSYRRDLLDHFPAGAAPTPSNGAAHPIYGKYGLTPPTP